MSSKRLDSKKKAVIIVFVLFIVLIVPVSYNYHKNQLEAIPVIQTDLAMNTEITQKIYCDDSNEAKDVEKKIIENIKELENKISRDIDGTQVSKINKNAGKYANVSNDLISYIKTSNEISKESNGVFDLSVGNLTDLWQIGKSDAKVPSKSELQQSLSTIDYKRIKFKDNELSIGKGQSLDFGSIGKGIACDKAKEILKKSKVSGAVISSGSSILLYGKNPNSTAWNVAIKNPRGDTNKYMGILSVGECFVSTSGDYERYFIQDGKIYHHILNPRTGYPADSGIISVTIICDSGIISDILSTACFILGYKDSLPLLEKYNAQAVFIDKDYNVYLTDGIKSNFKITNNKYKLVKS